MKRIRAELPKYRGLELDKKDIAQFRVNRLISSTLPRSREQAGFEREICELERAERSKANLPAAQDAYPIPPCVFRGMVAGTDSEGGYLVSDQNAPQAFANYLYAQSVIVPRSTQLTDLKDRIAITQETGKLQVHWGEEAGQATESQQTFGSVGMSPHELKVTTIVSKHLAQQSDPTAEGMVRQCMMMSFAEEFDTKILYGTGQNNQIRGLAEIAAIRDNALSYDPVDVYRDDLTPATERLGKANAADMLAWLIGWEFHSAASKRYALLENRRMLGIEAVPSSVVANGDAWLGNWQYLVTGMWGGMDIMTDTYSLMASGQIRIVGHYRVDAAVQHDDAFVQIKSD